MCKPDYVIIMHGAVDLQKEYHNIVGYVDLYSVQKKSVTEKGSYDAIYCQDHFHPNGSGYLEIAKVLGEIIVSDMALVNI